MQGLLRSARDYTSCQSRASLSESKMMAKLTEIFDLKQSAAGRSCDLLVLKHPSVIVRNKYRVQTSRQRRINVGFRGIADHPALVNNERVLIGDGAIRGLILLTDNLDCCEVIL